MLTSPGGLLPMRSQWSRAGKRTLRLAAETRRILSRRISQAPEPWVFPGREHIAGSLSRDVTDTPMTYSALVSGHEHAFSLARDCGGDANRVDRLVAAHLLEAEASVLGIACAETVRLSCEPLNIRWQFVVGSPETGRCTRFHSLSGSSCVALPALISARASSASLLRASWEPENA